jgi:hypothetical protein
MRRRALLTSAALGLAASAGCLADARRTLSGDVRHDHSRLTVHAATDRFVRGGLAADSEDRFRAWVFPEAPSADQTVFTDALGADDQREWDNEVHNENYGEGFMLLVQSRSARADPHQTEPAFPADPEWTGWRRARVPFEFARRDLDDDVAPDADRVVSTYLGYYAAETSPTRATVAVHSAADGAEMGEVIEEVDARRWTPP